MIRLAVPVLLRIARSSVDGSPIRITFDTDLKVIRSSVNGVLLKLGTAALNVKLFQFLMALLVTSRIFPSIKCMCTQIIAAFLG